MFPSFSSLQTLSIVLLVAQNTCLVILMRYSRSNHLNQLYSTTSAVFVMEIVKFVACLFLLLVEKCFSFRAFLVELYEELLMRPFELLKVAVPAILFTIQTNLLYYAISRIDVVTFQGISQLKLLTTAFFSVVMLKKSLSGWQWVACGLLALGVTLTQLANFKKSEASMGSAALGESVSVMTDAMMGMMAVICAAITSGFSSVYFEKILKNSTTSLWIRNLQMGLFSIFFAGAAMMMSSDWTLIVKEGTLFHDYTAIVIAMIGLQALGGLVVALVMKHTDNIVKGFAASVSIGLSWLLCAVFFDYDVSMRGLAGMILIMLAVSLYSSSPPNVSSSPVGLKQGIESPVSSAASSILPNTVNVNVNVKH